MHEHIRDICRWLALEGYLAVAPALYFREGDPNDYHDIPTLFSKLISKVPDSQVLSDLDHAANWAAALAGFTPRTTLSSALQWPSMAA